MTTNTTRRGHASTYRPTHGSALFPPLATHGSVLRSCGRCGAHTENRGGHRHRVLGWVGPCCAKGRG